MMFCIKNTRLEYSIMVFKMYSTISLCVVMYLDRKYIRTKHSGHMQTIFIFQLLKRTIQGNTHTHTIGKGKVTQQTSVYNNFIL